MKKAYSMAAIGLLSLSLTACGDTAPKCSDSSTIDSVKRILVKNNVLRGFLEYEGNSFSSVFPFSPGFENYELVNIISEKQLENKRGWVCTATAEVVLTESSYAEAMKQLTKSAEYVLEQSKIKNDYIDNATKQRNLQESAKELQRLALIIKNKKLWFSKSKDIKYTIQLTDSGETLVSASWSRY